MKEKVVYVYRIFAVTYVICEKRILQHIELGKNFLQQKKKEILYIVTLYVYNKEKASLKIIFNKSIIITYL